MCVYGLYLNALIRQLEPAHINFQSLIIYVGEELDGRIRFFPPVYRVNPVANRAVHSPSKCIARAI